MRQLFLFLPQSSGVLFVGFSLAVVCALSLLSVDARAASTVDTFSFESAELEARYRGLIAQIRCPKCQNVNIAGSDAPIAKDLRITVHRLLGEGRSDAEILDFLQARYGDFVLYDPPVRGNTLLLWLLPLAGFAVGLLVIVNLARRKPAVDELTGEEKQQLDALLAEASSHTQHGQHGQTDAHRADAVNKAPKGH